MSDLSRRSFLQLFGLGSAAVTAGISPVFTDPVRPEFILGGGSHWVFDRGMSLNPDTRAYHLFKGLEGRSNYIMMRGPRNKIWSPQGDVTSRRLEGLVDYQVEGVRGEDPHIAFFLAATEMQDRINKDILEYGEQLGSLGLTMVTVVDTPITAVPRTNAGFGIFTQLRQFAAKPSDIYSTSPLSKKGEVPITMPNNIDFMYICKMQDELRTMGMLERPSPGEARRTNQWKEAVREANRRSRGLST